ncbi:MAG: transcription antitermination factor NusB [Alphaproteobacteria bacterium]
MITSFKSRRLGRLSAVQALYQLEQRQTTTAAVIVEFAHHRLTDPGEGPIDEALFEGIVEGASEHKEALDASITSVLADAWRIERLDSVLKAILRAGFYELEYALATPAGVIINDYVEITKQFFDGREPAFVNGALDSGGKLLRKESL